MHIVTQLYQIELDNSFQAKYCTREWSVFGCQSSESTPLPCMNYDAYLLSVTYSPIYSRVSYLSAMILLFIDLKGALSHAPEK
jgi:hypothetical protein